jgi:small subunit ribosomal protein S6
MNRDYEALVIVKALGTDADVAQAVAQAEEPIKKLGGRVTASKPLGRRRLAYRIGRQQEGYYQLFDFQMDPLQVDELKRLLRLNETVVRFLVLNRADQKPGEALPNVDAKPAAVAGSPIEAPAWSRRGSNG